MMTPILTRLTFDQRPRINALPTDATLIAQINAVPDWRHLPPRELANQLGHPPKMLNAAVARLRACGQLAPASEIGMVRLDRLRQLNALLATPGRYQIGDVAARLLGGDSTSRRAQLKELVAQAQREGLASDHLDRLICPPAGQPAVNRQCPLHYIGWGDADPEHRARFIRLLRDLGPARSPRQHKEARHAA